ncbi:hypothetical protein CDL15_Pgr013903 [Punica granatum]|nr:hypothetical protein CDL15_Pgr013903 [Punica granatum]PKI72618.1 hypothetical protein CRG98_006995 [Punica granatum]
METGKPLLRLLLLYTITVSVLVISPTCAGAPLQYSTMFVFGDSLVDDGNNNYLSSLAKANYLPYGVDFFGGPSGRFCNGKTIIDFLGELLGLPYLPPYVNTIGNDRSILRGVNFASAAAGILDVSGSQLGDRFTLNQQIANFENTVNQLKNPMEEKELREFLAKSLVVMNIGSNDYLNNYLLPSIYPTSSIYNPREFADLLIRNYTAQILMLHGLGVRKFLIGAVGPLGCMPNQIARVDPPPPPGKCVTDVNELVSLFNTRLVSLVDQLNSRISILGAVFVYGNTFDLFTSILNRAESYGFKVVDRGCCGIGRNRGQITCLPLAFPCLNRDEYVFWDAFHPTQAFNKIIAQRVYSGPTSDCYPMNLHQMAQL